MSTFKYIFIPSDETQPITEFIGDGSGGLENDSLLLRAKEYFFERNGGKARQNVLQNLTAEERKIHAAEIRNEFLSHGENVHSNRLLSLNDDTLIQMVGQSLSTPSAEIIAVTVPTALNGYRAVSFYGDDNAKTRGYPLNVRATALLKACGHDYHDKSPSSSTMTSTTTTTTTSSSSSSSMGVYGDIFVGRCHDDEKNDIWERVDFTIPEAQGNLDQMEWCRIARRKGGGGGGGGGGTSSPTSSTSLLQNALSMNAHTKSSTEEDVLAGQNAQSQSYKWSQTEEELEIRWTQLPKGTKAKDVQIQFKKKSLHVAVQMVARKEGQDGNDATPTTLVVLCEGELWGEVIVDHCTYTLQDDPTSTHGERELCITLGKRVEEYWTSVFSIS